MLEISDKNFKGAVIKMLQEQLQILLKQMKQSHQRNESYGGLITKSCLTLATPWAAACQAPLSMRFLRQEEWNGLSFPSLGDLLDPGIKPGSPALQADSLLSEPSGKTPKREGIYV